MLQTTTMTIRLPKATKNRLERLALATERTKAYLAAKAIEEYLNTQEWQIQAIQEALAEAKSPGAKFVEHAAVVKKMKAKMAKQRRKKH